jgi:O-antigen/teichoic acid export membrane protein
MKKTTLSSNAMANVFQMGLSAVLLFLLYRYLAVTLGIAKLGVWSVVLASVSASRIADFGLSDSITRFVAKYLALDKPCRAAQTIETAALTLSVVLALLLMAVYPLLSKILSHLFNADYLPDALSLLPYALLSLWVSIVAAVFQSGLDGCQRMDVRAGLVLAGQTLLLVLTFWLVPQFGLIGLAWAQLGQSFFLLFFGWWLLRKHLPQLSRVPRCWRRDILREIIGYGFNAQFASLCMILFDPLTKVLMVRFGGVIPAGYFELANQVVVKMRALIVSANQAVVPKVAQLTEVLPQRLSTIYHENMRLIALVTLPTCTLLFAWAGIASRLLLGGYNSEFVFFMQIATLAWALNTFASPAYFANLGTGYVVWNTLSHVTMGLFNAILCFLLGSYFGAKGVALGYAGSLVVGSWLLIAIFHKLNDVSWGVLFSREHLGLASASMVILVYATLEVMMPIGDENKHMAILLLFPPLTLGVSVWFHPLRKQLLTQFLNVPAGRAAK